jgi:hypothetical protein
MSLRNRTRLTLPVPSGSIHIVSTVAIARKGPNLDALIDNNVFLRAAAGHSGFPDAVRQIRDAGFHINPIAGMCEQIISNVTKATPLLSSFRNSYGHETAFDDFAFGDKEVIALASEEHPDYVLEIKVLQNSMLHFATVIRKNSI